MGVLLQGAAKPLLTNVTRALTSAFTDAAASGVDDVVRVTWRSTWDDVVDGVSTTWNAKVPFKPRTTTDAPPTTGASAVESTLRTPTSAEEVADAALADGRISGAAAALRVGSQVFTDVSTGGLPRVLNESVQEALDAVPLAQQAPWHGHCAEGVV